MDKWDDLMSDIGYGGRLVYDADLDHPNYWAGRDHLLSVLVHPTPAVLVLRTPPTEADVERWADKFYEKEGRYPSQIVLCGGEEDRPATGEPAGYGILLAGVKGGDL